MGRLGKKGPSGGKKRVGKRNVGQFQGESNTVCTVERAHGGKKGGGAAG